MKINLEKCLQKGFEQAIENYELSIGMTLKEAIEKQIPKKPNIPWDTEREICPICQSGFLGEPSYCSNCGQAIDWSKHTTEQGGE